jgi:glyoxylase-like metal-dependent hydrolase (beta-lactamase superfamily II)
VTLLAPLSLLLALAGPTAPPEAIAPEVYLVPGTFIPGSQPDGNTLVIRAPEGLLVVDTGRHTSHVQAILDLASRWKLPIQVVVNTHWHLDHVSGNLAVHRAFPGVNVLASDAIEDARRGFLADYRKQLEGVLATADDPAARQRWKDEMARIDSGAALGPDLIVRGNARRTLAGRPVRLGLAGGAVTAGDVWMLDEESGVLAAGDLVTLPAPLLDTACPAGWKVALAQLSALPFRTLVPGHGRPMDRAGFDRWRTGFERLLSCAATDAAEATCLDGWVADLGPLLPEAERAFARDLLRYYLPAVLRAPPERTARACGVRKADGTVR